MSELRTPGEDQPTVEAPPKWPEGGASRFPPGTLLAGRYRVVYPLGRGGMGEVYRADDLKLGQPVALKFVRHSLAAAAKQRLYDEVRLGRQISHPSVCRLYDIVEVEGLTFIAMEYVDGEDLASLLSRIGHLPADKTLEIGRDLCGGLQAAHDRGVLHRDLKPANIMIDGRGRARLTDFGLAVEEKRTAPGDTSGTALYMSPEQLAGSELTARSDLYSLGLVLYEMVAGRRFFDAGTLDELRSQHRSERLSRLGALSGQVDSALQRVIAACLEEDAQRRPASARGVLALLPGGDALEAALAAGATPAPDVVAAAGPVGDLSRAAAWGALAAFTGILAVIVLLTGGMTLLPTTPPAKTPEILAERARFVLSSLGKLPPPVDAKGYFEWDFRRIRRIRRDDQSADRFDRLRQSPLPSLLFYYRQSPELLVAANRHGFVERDDPPVNVPGMAEVVLGPQGQLIGYLTVPPQVEAGGPWPDTDWAPFFHEAQLDAAAFQPVPSEWSAPVDSDHKTAWQGHYPGAPEIPLRIEAASYHGRAVWFALLSPWSSPELGASAQSPSAHSAPMGPALQAVLALALPLGGLLLVRRNLRLKRGDRKGSLRVALFVFACYSLARLAHSDHVAQFGSEFWLLIKVFAYPMVFAALVWTFYLAIEPYARRQWPRILISWGRLLAGRWRDPMVGRDVLLGAVGASVVFAMATLWTALEAANGLPQRGTGLEDPEMLTSWSMVAYRVCVNLHSAVLWSIVWLFVLVLLRALLRRDGLALVAWGTLIGAQFFNAGSGSATGLLIALLLSALLAVLMIAVLTRGGLLGFSTTNFVLFAASGAPLVFDGSLWWAPRGWAILAVLATLGVWAFRTSLGGKPAFGDWLEA
ncbi:MAG: serine/threonine-protein kinase [Solirubrobacterales bacterium]|jgi:serine/threonine-protein kinase